MNKLWRLFFTWCIARFRTPVNALGPCSTPFRVWPNDLDVLWHMNNGVYFSLLDLGRVDLMLRSKLYPICQKNGWYPVVVGETMYFKKAIKVFQRFEMVTKVLGWSDKEIIVQQDFVRSGEVCASAVVAARFLKKSGGTVVPEVLMENLGLTPRSPQMEPWITAWYEAQRATRALKS